MNSPLYELVGVVTAVATFTVIFTAAVRAMWVHLPGAYRLFMIPGLPLAVAVAGLAGWFAAPFWPVMLILSPLAALGCVGTIETIRSFRR